MTVITAKQIEARGITKIDQLFRGEVPGVFAHNQGSSNNAALGEVTMYSRGATALSGNSVGVSLDVGNTNPIKTYIDGVEMADPQYLSQIDPRSIERIEILTGPQASTIYGSNAINGVMQIFTKRGASNAPQFTLNLLSGWVENNFRSTRTPQHDYSAQLNGIEGRLSYNAGGSWQYMGPWTPSNQTTRTSAFGGGRLDVLTAAGHITGDVTFRRQITLNRVRGSASQKSTNYAETGWYRQSFNGLSQPSNLVLTGQTLGITLGYAPAGWWSHELAVGQDASDTESRTVARGYGRPGDTTLSLTQNHNDRRSFHYTTTVRAPVTSFASLTVTTGADTWQNLTTFFYVSSQTLTGSLVSDLAPSIDRQPGHNTGGFVQAQLGVADQLFLTYGLRAEWNPTYGAEAQPNYAPRYGIAYTHDMNTPFGAITAKWRASYGRATRPPGPLMKAGRKAADVYGGGSSVLTYFGNFDFLVPNPKLGPEYQQGGEGGIELYIGTRTSLVVTRYNQTINGLTDAPTVDSVRSSTVCTSPCFANTYTPDGYGYFYEAQYVNLGSIRNQGWELQGKVNLGSFAPRATYSWTKSRVLGITPTYRAFFTASDYPQYQPGATFQYLPEHTWALGTTYAQARATLDVTVSGKGRNWGSIDALAQQHLTPVIRLVQNRWNIGTPFSRVMFSRSYTIADLTVSYRLSAHAESVLQAQNLTDRYENDLTNTLAALGRQMKMGFRIRL